MPVCMEEVFCQKLQLILPPLGQAFTSLCNKLVMVPVCMKEVFAQNLTLFRSLIRVTLLCDKNLVADQGCCFFHGCTVS